VTTSYITMKFVLELVTLNEDLIQWQVTGIG